MSQDNKESKEAGMVSTLSQSDVARLLAEPSPAVRAEVAGKLAQEIDNPRLSESELQMAHDIVRVMAKDVEVIVRRALAQSLRRAARLPREVALKLASDVEIVASPILSSSPVLTDEDLIEIVKHGSSFKQEAIAARVNVSEQLSDALITNASEKAVATLMGNATAQISAESMDKAVDRFPQSAMVKENMVKRPVLPMTIAERLVTLVADNLKEYLVGHHELPPSVASDIVMQSRERAIMNLAAGSSEQDTERLIVQMYRSKRLTPSLVLRALCLGDIGFFETALAVLANVPTVNARLLIHDAGRQGLKSLYEKAGLPPRLLPAVRVAIDVVHETEMDGGPGDLERFRSRVIERVLTQYEDFAPEDLDYLLEKLGDAAGVVAA